MSSALLKSKVHLIIRKQSDDLHMSLKKTNRWAVSKYIEIYGKENRMLRKEREEKEEQCWATALDHFPNFLSFNPS